MQVIVAGSLRQSGRRGLHLQSGRSRGNDALCQGHSTVDRERITLQRVTASHYRWSNAHFLLRQLEPVLHRL